VAEGCVQAGCALIGGETAEMPGFYPGGRIRPGRLRRGHRGQGEDPGQHRRGPEGDAVLALPSSGPHSNGFSLVRKALDVENDDLAAPCAALGGDVHGRGAAAPTRIYVKPMLALMDGSR
jgi:phosphoribosylformylglycinamidine cyclo-ligase